MKRVNVKGVVSRTSAWILSAALAFSSCPISVQAEENIDENKQATEEQQKEVVEENSSVGESKSDEDVSEADEVEVKKSEETEEKTVDKEEIEEVSSEEVVEKTTEETSEEMTTTEEAVTEVETVTEEETVTIEEEKIGVLAEIGDVVKTCPTIGENGKVTFHYYPEAGEEVTSAYVKGSWDSNWQKYFYMDEDEAGAWSVTADLSLEDSYEYGIVVNNNWVGDPTNPRIGGSGNSQILRNPSVNDDGSVTIFYYPQGEEDVNLLYKLSDETEYTSVDMTTDAYHSALLSATVSAQGDYTYMFEVDGNQTADINCKEAAFSIGKLPENDLSVKSPVVNGNVVTFNYYGPTDKSVYLAGEMNGWSATATSFTYNKNTGFWTIEKELDPGKYEYKFVVNGNWITDPRNEAYSNGNNPEWSMCA